MTEYVDYEEELTLKDVLSFMKDMKKDSEDRFQELNNRVLMMTPMKPSQRPQPVEEERRSTIYGKIGQEAAQGNVTPRGTQEAEASKQPSKPLQGAMLKVPQKVDESLIIKTLSIRAVLLMRDNHRTFTASTGDDTKKLSHFVERRLIKDVVDNEHRLGTEVSEWVTYDNIYEVTDKLFMQMVARKLRPLTADDYNSTFIAQIRHLNSLHPAWKFGVASYDDELHGPVAKLLEHTEATYRLFEVGSTKAEAELWPKLEYGSKERPGLFRLFMKLFRTFEDNFTELVGVDNLKAMKTAEEFFRALHKVNNSQCDEAKKLKALNARSQKPRTLDDLVKEVGDKRMQTEFMRGKEYNGQYHAGRDAHPSSKALGAPRMSQLADEDVSPGFSPDLKYASRAQVHPDYDDCDLEEGEEIRSLRALLGLEATPKRTGVLFDPKSGKVPVDRSTMPCFTHFKEPHEGPCAYSHREAHMHEVRNKYMQALLSSPFAGDDWVEKEVHKFRAAKRQVGSAGPAAPGRSPGLRKMGTEAAQPEPDPLDPLVSQADGGPAPINI